MAGKRDMEGQVVGANTVDSGRLGLLAGNRGRALACLALIMGTGLFVRVYRMYDESFWWDEFTSIVHLRQPEAWENNPQYARWNQVVVRETAPNLLAFLKANRSMDPATMPLYYTLEYLWNKHVSREPQSLRWLSIVIGMMLIPAIYAFGRNLFGRHAGLIAAFCVAMSPLHRQFAQEIRMYALMTLLALLSAYTFVELHRSGGRKWWFFHGLANFFLFWTHPFALLLPLMQGLFWLFFRSWPLSRFLSLVKWGVMNAVLLVPTAVYMATIRFWSSESTGGWMRMPAPDEFLGDLFGDDCAGMTWQLSPLRMMWEPMTLAWRHIFSPELAHAIASVFVPVGLLMTAGFAVCALALCVRAVLRRKAAPDSWDWPVFLSLWWLGPPLVLLVVSVLMRPCIMPRYTLPSSLGLYLLLGAGIMAVRWRWARRAAVAALVAGFVYQQMLVLEGPRHTDYLGASAVIQREGKSDDFIFVHNSLWKRVFAFNFGPSANIISCSEDYANYPNLENGDYRDLAEVCAFTAGQEWPSTDAGGGSRGVWAVIKNEYFQAGPAKLFEVALESRGLSFDRFEFRGLEPMLVYHVKRSPGVSQVGGQPVGVLAPKVFCGLSLDLWRAQDYEHAAAAARRAAEIEPGYVRAFSYLGMALQETGDLEGAAAAFVTARLLNPGDYPWSLISLGNIYNKWERFDEAIDVLKEAQRQLPSDSWVHTSLGKAYLGKGDIVTAISTLQRAMELDPSDGRPRDVLDTARKALEARSAPAAQ